MKNIISIQQDVTIKHLNTFGIEIRADYFSIVNNASELSDLLSMDHVSSLPKLILGEGSNILFTKNFPGLVIKNAIKGIQVVDEDDNHCWIKAGSGENWHDFVMHCIDQGYGGLENLSLIPGTVGAAPIQNIGAYGVEVCQTIVQLEALKLDDASIHVFDNHECQFGYRDSIFKKSHKDKYAILSVVFKLNKNPTFHVDYGNLKETLSMMCKDELSIKSISDAVIHIRRSKLPDPKIIGNAGSFFKNPIISTDKLIELQLKYPRIPHFSIDNSASVKLNAAWLIEQCGWKGKRIGDVGVYEKQALVLINHGEGSGAAVMDLAKQIQDSVQHQFGIQLDLEVNLI